MLKVTYADNAQNIVEVYEDNEKLQIVVIDRKGDKVTEVVLNSDERG
jgi:hypothetical protein